MGFVMNRLQAESLLARIASTLNISVEQLQETSDATIDAIVQKALTDPVSLTIEEIQDMAKTLLLKGYATHINLD